MARVNTRSSRGNGATPPDAVRLVGADRRQVLLDAAAALVASGEVDLASMEAVADRAGVSRALVYKHFANRADLLNALYRREATLLYEQIVAEVRAADGVVDMYRRLLRASLRAARERHAVFVALHAAGARTRAERDERHQRDQHTVDVFTGHAIAEFGLPAPTARAISSLLLAAVNAAVLQWLRDPTPEHASVLEETYVGLVTGGLSTLSDRAMNH